MSPAPKISVIMPCFNAAAHVAESVRCVLGQTWADLELIVVDDGSSDGSARRVEGFRDPRVRLFRQANAGVSAARNAGLRAARGEYVAFLDADDTWTADCLEALHAALSAHPDAVLAYCGWQNLGLPGPRGEPHVPPDYEALADRMGALLAGCPWPIHAALVRAGPLSAVGGFDPTLAVAEDYLLWLRLAARGRLVRVPRVLARYHHHSSGLQASGNAVRAVRQTRRALMTFLGEAPDVARRLDPAQRRQILHGPGLTRAYERLWARDLETAQRLFRDAVAAGYVRRRDLRYALAAVLPRPVFRALVGAVDAVREGAPQ